jgi:putative hemolysin
LQVRYRVTPRDRAQIPPRGPAVVVANHPFGLLEPAILAAFLREIRPDIRFLANERLAGLPEIEPYLIPVRLDAPRAANLAATRRALEFLLGGGLLVVFPAGAVSHFQWQQRASTDPAWSPAVARLIALAAHRGVRAPTIPVYVPGSNSVAFHLAGLVHPRLRTALLARELFNKERREVELRIGRPVPADKLLALPSDQERIHYLRWRTYLLAERAGLEPRTAEEGEPVAASLPGPALAAEVAALSPECLLDRAGGLEVYLVEAPQAPLVLREIGALRERTFRAAGEGTGHALDLDRFDWYYKHLFVWDPQARQVVGAYRLQEADSGAALYTRTLFDYDQRLLDAMGPAIELGRSFVRPEYQRSFAPLLLLWKGIGKFVAAHLRYKVLFGPVSISNQYHARARELMVAFLEKEAGMPEWRGLVQPRNAPGRPAAMAPMPCRDLEELSEVISDLVPSVPGVPVLLRQYLRLGGRLLGFHVDRTFSNVLDGLIVVDLTKTDPKILERYLGKTEAATFLEHHGVR